MHQINPDISKIDLNIKVLTQSHWPVKPGPPYVLPEPMSRIQSCFESVYTQQFLGKKLTWCSCLGNGIVSANFRSAKRELYVSTPQMIILHLFNLSPQYKFAQIREMTQIEQKLL